MRRQPTLAELVIADYDKPLSALPEPTSDCPDEPEHYAALIALGECPYCGQTVPA